MRKILLAFVLVISLMAQAQQPSFRFGKNSSLLTYNVYSYGVTIDTSHLYLELFPDHYCFYDEQPGGNLIPGLGNELTSVYFDSDSLVQFLNYADTSYYYSTRLSRSDIEWTTKPEENNRTRHICSVNSNRLELVMQNFGGRNASPLAYYGKLDGVLVEFWRNGQLHMELANVSKTVKKATKIDTDLPKRNVSPRQMNTIQQQRMIISTLLFDDVQLCWGKQNSHVEGEIPFDSVLHFAGGTLALKCVQLPTLPSHYQTFVEIHQRSNGDAYDRTGSLFVVPMQKARTFFDGINNHPDSLPTFVARDGQHYQGIVATDDYEPIVELVRFFTSFGVGKFNERVKIDGLVWEDENYFKQEVTELSPRLQGDVLIGVWIGNYDGGGHRVTVDLKSYPNDYQWAFDDNSSEVIPIFNTCNVLEMAGQNYGRLFGTDSLTARFTISEGDKDVSLRYITTGHGGWDGGDEFNPKANTILIDGKPAFVYTPWRCDCGRYREWNPVSGNFWNAMSSSDFSRSGWCPGTATQPVYFDLSDLEAGEHTITIAIPQGEPMGGSFSHWCVSGAIIKK